MAKKRIQIKIVTEQRVIPSLSPDRGNTTFVSREAIISKAAETSANISSKEQKELSSFCLFASSNDFSPCLATLGLNVTSNITITLNSDGDDPPDITLENSSGENIGIEITDYPPNHAVLTKASELVAGPSILPSTVQTGTSLKDTIAYMEKPVSMVKPDMTSCEALAKNLESYLTKQLREKDIKGNTIILLHGSRFEHPEVDVVKAVVSKMNIKHVKCIIVGILSSPKKYVPIFTLTPSPASSK